ncbi:MAG: NAAT family transporter [Roseibacillus sp.]|nr:NAAT family transporter [Roseibacillus sp.]
MSTAAFLKAFMGLFAMMNPIGNTGIFISTVGDLPTSFKIKAALKTSVAVLIILEISIFAGTALLQTFGISLAAFQAAGGLIVVLIGLKMITGGENTAHHTQGAKKSLAEIQTDERAVNDKLIVPLAMPILGGPGSIATVVTVAAAYPTLEGSIGTAVGTAALVATLFVCFAFSGLLSRFLNDHAQEIILRFMGLILVAIGGDMILGGVEHSVSHFFLGAGPPTR